MRRAPTPRRLNQAAKSSKVWAVVVLFGDGRVFINSRRPVGGRGTSTPRCPSTGADCRPSDAGSRRSVRLPRSSAPVPSQVMRDRPDEPGSAKRPSTLGDPRLPGPVGALIVTGAITHYSPAVDVNDGSGEPRPGGRVPRAAAGSIMLRKLRSGPAIGIPGGADKAKPNPTSNIRGR